MYDRAVARGIVYLDNSNSGLTRRLKILRIIRVLCATWNRNEKLDRETKMHTAKDSSV
jgi:hypothetical protein